MSYNRSQKEEKNVTRKSIKVTLVFDPAATVEKDEKRSNYWPTMKNHIVYVSIGKGPELVLEQYSFMDQFDMVRSLGLIVRRRLNLLDSTMEEYCDPHVYTFKGGLDTYKMIDLVSGGFFYCVGSYPQTDPMVIESIFHKLVCLVEANFSDFQEIPRCIRYKLTLSYLLSDHNSVMCIDKKIYSDDISHRSQLCQSRPYDSVDPKGALAGEGPAVHYVFIARKSRIIAEFINWMDGLDKLTELANDVFYYKPWNQSKTWNYVCRLGKDYYTLLSGDFVYFICSTSISGLECRSALRELCLEFAKRLKYDKGYMLPGYFWFKMRNIFLNLLNRIKGEVPGKKQSKECEKKRECDGSLEQRKSDESQKKRKVEQSASSLDNKNGEPEVDGKSGSESPLVDNSVELGRA